jgi:hypothetical protein
MPFELDTTFFPVIVIDFSPTMSDAELRDYTQAHGELVRRAHMQGLASVNIATSVAQLSSAQRKLITDWAARMRAETKKPLLPTFLVVRNPIQRHVITALTWLMPEMKAMHRLVESCGAAARGAVDTLIAQNVPVNFTADALEAHLLQRKRKAASE